MTPVLFPGVASLRRRRGMLMIVDLENASRVPHVTEPLMLAFDASVHYRVAMSPEELQSAGLDRFASM